MMRYYVDSTGRGPHIRTYNIQYVCSASLKYDLVCDTHAHDCNIIVNSEH